MDFIAAQLFTSPNDDWEISVKERAVVDDEKKPVVLLVRKPVSTIHDEILQKASNLDSALRILIFVRRFVFNYFDVKRPNEKKPADIGIQNQNKLLKMELKVDQISPKEYSACCFEFARRAQEQIYPKEVTCLSQGEPIDRSSALLACNPYWDEDVCVIRVGGRLKNADLSEREKHPIILPANHRFTRLLFEAASCRADCNAISNTSTVVASKWSSNRGYCVS